MLQICKLASIASILDPFQRMLANEAIIPGQHHVLLFAYSL